MSKRSRALIAGGGIGGLAAALAVSKAGWDVQLLERAPAFGEFGAGIQLGPNVTHILQGWGLADALKAVAAFPDHLEVRSAGSGVRLGQLPLGAAMAQRYGAPYATVHRADLQALLLQAVQQQTDTLLQLDHPLLGFTQAAQLVTVHSTGHPDRQGDVLLGADGLWGPIRQQLLQDGPPRRTGHLAYRALVRQADLPQSLRSQQVTVWLGPRMHVVHYPVRCGEWLNLVILMQGDGDDGAEVWDHRVGAADLANIGKVVAGSCPALADLVQALSEGPGWRRWALYDRLAMTGPQQHASGRVALLGDAAHPMRPYLAQGAGMAIEDAAELGRVLAHAQDPAFDVPAMLQRFALNRWRRNARVQARAHRNGQLFHADGVLRLARDAGMRLLGEKILDMPWLYGGGVHHPS